MFMALCVTLAVCDLLGVAGLRFQLAIHGLEMTSIVRAESLHDDDHDNEQQHSDGGVGFREECCDYRLTLRPDTTKSNYRGGYDVEGYVPAPVRLHMSLKEFLGIFIPFHSMTGLSQSTPSADVRFSASTWRQYCKDNGAYTFLSSHPPGMGAEASRRKIPSHVTISPI